VSNLIKCHLVHGFNIKDGGSETIDRLIPHLDNKKLVVVQHDYGHLRIRGVLRKNKVIAAKIKNHLGKHDVAIGHSNGCAILVKSLQQGGILDKLILINPALDKRFEFPDSVNEVHVFHNKHDKAVVMAKWLRKLVFWRNSFLWGEMGNTGYKGDDKRVTNHVLAKGHSAVFNNKNINEFSVMITDIIKS
jgi:hypothetical protein